MWLIQHIRDNNYPYEFFYSENLGDSILFVLARSGNHHLEEDSLGLVLHYDGVFTDADDETKPCRWTWRIQEIKHIDSL